MQNDRVVIGTNSAFVVNVPDQAPRQGNPDVIDWEMAQDEL